MKITQKNTFKKRRERKQKAKKEKIVIEINKIKESNLVRNFSSIEIPDSAYLYLALGSGFVPAKTAEKHDYIFDAKEFGKKLAWKVYHEKNKKEKDENDDKNEQTDTKSKVEVGEDDIINLGKLNIKSRKCPEMNDKLLDNVINAIQDGIENIKFTKKLKRNLTIQENEGLKWCQKMTRTRTVYITKVDKGGSILILNADIVDEIVLEKLEEPREKLKREIKRKIIKYTEDKLLTEDACIQNIWRYK